MSLKLFIKLLFSTLLLITLAACGGGGGSDSPPPPSGPSNQTITFDNEGPLERLVGLSVTNEASGGAGSGAITYESSNTDVATVGVSSGEVTVTGGGDATITAVKAADDDYNEAQASYTISGLDTVDIKIWIGGYQGDFTFPESVLGADLLGTSEANCDPANILGCAGGYEETLSNTTFSDGELETFQPASYFLRAGSATSNELRVGIDRFEPRIGHGAAYFQGKYWVVAGGDRDNPLYNDVWSSEDGTVWELVAASQFPVSRFSKLYVFDDKLWLYIASDEVYNSEDGLTWDQVTVSGLPLNFEDTFNTPIVYIRELDGQLWFTAGGTTFNSTNGLQWNYVNSAAPSARVFSSFTAFDNYLWLIAGNFPAAGGGNSIADIWRMDSSGNWVQITDAADFNDRSSHVAFVWDDKLWVMGGRKMVSNATDSIYSDTWSTEDGTTWTESTNDHEVDRHYFGQSVVGPDGVKLIGGIQANFSNQVWHSDDIANWTELSPHSEFNGRVQHKVVEFDGALWMVGGHGSENVVSNEIWRSEDGTNWSRVNTTGTIFSPRQQHGLTVHDGYLWVVGGTDNTENNGGVNEVYNDVWRSSDGMEWELVTDNPGFVARSGHGLVAFDGNLYVIGGHLGDGEPALDDVWSSANGTDWEQETAAAGFGNRTLMTVEVLNGAMILMGGLEGTTVHRDVWSSTDGANWTLIVDPATFPARYLHASTVHNGQLFLATGATSTDLGDSGIRLNDVWASDDGSNWTLVNGDAIFTPRSSGALVSFQDTLYLIGGGNQSITDQVWRSPDGDRWQVNVTETIDFP